MPARQKEEPAGPLLVADTKSRKPLSPTFFARDVDVVARALIGVELKFRGVGGRIVETESYDPTDPASHSYGARLTPRNSIMFGPAGYAYVYRIYGMYWCLNFTCGHGSAVLIRALEPMAGLARMRTRRGTDDAALLCAGPGRLCQALDITGADTGRAITASPFRLTHQRPAGRRLAIVTGARIGLSRGVEALRRYGLRDSAFLSKRFADADRAVTSVAVALPTSRSAASAMPTSCLYR